jgi:leucyl aminopeptidase
VTSYTLRKASPDKVRTDVLVIGVALDRKGIPVAAPGAEAVVAAYGRRFAPLLASLSFRGTVGEVTSFPGTDTVRASRVVAVGVGPLASLTPELVRRAAGTASRTLGNAASVTIALPGDGPDYVRAVVEGFGTGLYRYDAYRSGAQPSGPADVVVLSETARRADTVAAHDRAVQQVAVTDDARDWVNTPPNDLVPHAFADAIVAAVAGSGLDVTVLDAGALTELGCGGILGVGNGSDNPPCLVRLTWSPPAADRHVALVGKGITYDSGGLTIKPGSSMVAMKSDMAGAAAVVAAMRAIAALDLPVRVSAYLPLAENMISGRAMRPGDVLTTLSGKTVEVTNTDAEGRLVLADALTMAVRDGVDAIVNVATLTGPCVVALGDRVAGLFGDDDTVAAIQDVATRTGELFWRLPIPPEQRASVRTESKIADLLQHNWVRWGSASYAAAFLEAFVDDTAWAHFDIAGPAYNSGPPWGHVPSGATGFAVSTLVEYVASLA